MEEAQSLDRPDCGGRSLDFFIHQFGIRRSSPIRKNMFKKKKNKEKISRTPQVQFIAYDK